MERISETARWVAWARAEESLRPDALFVDELAVEVRRRYPADRPVPGRARALFVIRTRFFDDYLTAMAEAGLAQIVLLAAGLDARAFRLAWPDGTRLFEVDLPGLFEEKEEVVRVAGIRPRCSRVIVPADLTGASWTRELAAAGFDCGVPTAWLAEGLLFYLAERQSGRLLSALGRLSAPGSALGLDHVNTAVFVNARSRQWLATMERSGRGWRSATDEPQRWLARHGWRADVREPADADVCHGREFAPAFLPGESRPRRWLITARLPDAPGEQPPLPHEVPKA
ncbi:SAM-dependent methyltransferase [Nonomuraea sp. KM90]|uniref:SAM-dependent methyltransferase n=1 Tax=Nonomuraea sp. KM90 TaxID=3457428 RepID=UPI003FCC9EAF